MKETTIAAISTPHGTGGIAVIRISGPDAVQTADRVFVASSGKKLALLKGYSAAYGHIYSGGERIDEAIATVFLAPHSYTGENVVELSCHGGMFITAQVLREVLGSGACPAQPGEFTKRAFLNGKLDLTEAEAVMELIGAKSRCAARTALNLKDGALSGRINEIKELLLDTAAHLNAWADYPEEDIEELKAENLKLTFNKAQNSLRELLDGYDKGQIILEGVDTVIAGKPNVGKSTLMNLLAGKEKSIVTDIPGTTRDIIESSAVLGDIVLKLSDTAGLRAADNEVEKIGVERSRKRLESCGLIFAVFDAGLPLEKEDFSLIEAASGIPAVAIINKADLPVKADTEYIASKIKNCVFMSAKSGAGLEDLTKAVNEALSAADFDPSQAILANERQRQAALSALNALNDAENALDSGMTFDAVTVAVEEAAACLLELTGEKTSDLVVEKVFHNFCVGK